MGTRDLIFVSYSHEDRVWLERLRVILKPYEVDGRLAVWADPYIKVGDRWHREIDTALARAAIGLLLVSPEFLASDFIREHELPALLAAAENGELTLFCVPVSPSPYHVSPIREFQWARDPEDPLDLLPDKGHWNRALVEIAKKLEQAFDISPVEVVAKSVTRLRVASHAPAAELAQVHGVPALPPHYVLRPEDLARLKRSLLEDRQATVGLTGRMTKVGVHGMGGIGKSVLAVALARDDDVRRAFPDGIFWLTFGQQANLVSLQTELAIALGEETPGIDSSGSGAAVLRGMLADRAALLILDDVWQMRDARAFDVVGDRSALLITTRDSGILTAVDAHEEKVDVLDEQHALSLLSEWSGGKLIGEVVHEIALKCGRLPLALSLAAAQVRDGMEPQTVLEALHQGKLSFLDHPYGSVFSALQLSVDALPAHERERYLELAPFPEDTEVPERTIAQLWSYTASLSELDTKKLLVHFARRGLLHLNDSTQRTVSFHDLQQDYLRLVAGDLSARHAAVVDAARASLPQRSQP